ncbi:MAG: CDP-alcohol phosphatidyltransferase family protein, partial [Planctomycetota bacterium]
MFRLSTERPPSIRRMRVICQREKLRKTNDLTRKHRAFSIYATWLLVQTPATADHVTMASIATGILAAACFATPGFLAGLAGCLLLYASFLLDQVDGEVARYRRKSSLRGVYLDEIRHLVVYAVPVFALGFDAVRRQGAWWPLAVSFAVGF